MDKRKILIDTDTGSDDAVAMLLALRDPSVEVVAVTTVAGNVPLEQATKNALITIHMAGTYAPPVYQGLAKPICSQMQHAFGAHGKDGMGDVGLVSPADMQPKAEHAVDALMRILKQHPAGELELVTLGPTCNIGTLIMRAPDLVKKLRRITVMGGAWMEPGDYWVPPAESNIRNDVESANLILGCGVPVVMVPINVCRGDILTTEEEIEMLTASGPVGKFSVDCNRTLIGFNKQRWGRAVIDPADPVAMAVALCPDCVEEKKDCVMEFETRGRYTRGVMVYDYWNRAGKPINATLITKVSEQRYKDYAYNLLRG